MISPASPAKFHTVVVGAGPSGSLAALLLAREGKSVALVDRARFPRPKICGDSLNPACHEIWRRCGLLESFNALRPWSSRSVEFKLLGRRVFQRDLETDADKAIRCVERAVLDHWLSMLAVEAGAEFFPETQVTSLDLANRTLATTAGDFAFNYLVGADGRNSTVARLAGLARSYGATRRIAWQARYPLDDTDSAVRGGIEMHVFRGGYYGLNVSDEGTANLSLILPATERRPPQVVARELFPGMTPQTWRSTYPLKRAAARSASGPVLLAGDAARLLEPFTGEGIQFALLTGEAAAQSILASTSPAESYRRRHRLLYQKGARINAFVQWAMDRPARAALVLRGLAMVPGLLASIFSRVYETRKERA